MAPHPDKKDITDGMITKAALMNEDRIQVDEFVYETKSLAEMHPGGPLFVKAFSGRDATEAFLSYHRRKFPHARLSHALVGSTEAQKKGSADEDYLELCKVIEQVLPRYKAFAPWTYYVKVAILLSSAIALEVYIHFTGEYKWYLTGLLGWLFALIGLNIQHDANHGAISQYHWVNRTLGMTQNWIGGSAVDWIHQHVVQHHINPNDTEHDPDIVGSDVIRLNPTKPMMKMQVFQHIYVFVLMALFGLTYIVGSFVHNMERFHKTKFSKQLRPNHIFEESTIALFFVRWFLFPVCMYPSLYTVLNIAPLLVVGGYYLSFFFLISHNFEGVHLFDEKYLKHTDQSFLRKQVLSGSNVGGAWLCFLNGGLNYQIEHHLFPRIQHSHYPTIAPFVRAYCESKGISYVHFPTIADNVASCARHLHSLGNRKTPVNFNVELPKEQ